MRHKNRNLLIVLVIVAIAIWVVGTGKVNVPGIGTRDGFALGLDLKGGTQVILQADFSKLAPGASRDDAMIGVVNIIESRVNGFGVTEPVIQQSGADRIIVELPGVKDIDQAVKLVGQTAQLEFREPVLDAAGQPQKDDKGNIVWKPASDIGPDGKEITLTGALLKPNSQVVLDSQTNQPQVAFEWNSQGAAVFEKVTQRLLQKPLGIFLDNELISAPTVQAVISDKGVITGLGVEEARLLAIQLNSGALPVPMSVVQRQDIDAILGKDSLDKSLLAGAIGLFLVLAFMVIYYRFPGFISCLALIVYGFLVLAVFKLIPVTFTLAGVAAFIISVGMAVDANVLISERTKEELRSGKTVTAAMEAGFNRAWTAIRDSNVSSLITCLILYWFGNQFGASSVKGFALTLGIGVLISMFSAITVSRTFLRSFLASGMGRKHNWFLGGAEKDYNGGTGA